MTQAMKTVPLRPNRAFMGSVSQHPIKAQHKYGALLTSPNNQESRPVLDAIPKETLKKLWAPLITVSSIP